MPRNSEGDLGLQTVVDPKSVQPKAISLIISQHFLKDPVMSGLGHKNGSIQAVYTGFSRRFYIWSRCIAKLRKFISLPFFDTVTYSCYEDSFNRKKEGLCQHSGSSVQHFMAFESGLL